MYNEFYNNKPFIEKEYEDAKWDESSGLCPQELRAALLDYVGKNADMPSPILVSNLYRITLENMQLGINGHTIFPDKMRHGGVYTRRATPGVLEIVLHERYEKALARECPAVRAQRSMLANCGLTVPDTDVWHTLYDWDEVLRLGAAGLLERAYSSKESKVRDNTLTPEQEIFYDAEIIAFEAVMTYIKRLKAASEEKGLTKYADTLANLLVAPPKTLYEVLCLTHIMLNVIELGKERCRSLGPVDELWLPFYTNDIANGYETRESIYEMFLYFWTKISAEKRYADQPICIGKAWESDDSAAAEFTLLMLDAYNELGIHNPKLHVRCKKNMSDTFLTYMLRMIRDKNSSLVLVNDETVFAGYEKIGIGREIANRYVPLGCYESCIMGLEDARICAAWINLSKACEYAITGGYDLLGRVTVGSKTSEPSSWEEFLSTYYYYLAEHCDIAINNVNEQAKHAYAAYQSPYYSGSIASCMESGRDVFNCGMVYRNQSIKCFAIATAVDSLLAVKKFVYEKKKVSLSELRAILENNWQGSEMLRAEIMKDSAKYGNHDGEADALTREIFAFCADQIIGKPTSTGGVFRLGCDSVDTAEIYGAKCGASADGRYDRTPLSKNMRPVNGMEKKGVTAFVQSVCEIDNTDFVDGAPLDFIMHPSAVEGEDGLNAMKAITRLFMQKGGMAFQGNILSLDMLLDAQKNPEKYRDLQVRVCGWNEYFVDMSKTVQNDFINRVAGIEK